MITFISFIEEYFGRFWLVLYPKFRIYNPNVFLLFCRQSQLCGRCLRGMNSRGHDELSAILDHEEEEEQLSLAESLAAEGILNPDTSLQVNFNAMNPGVPNFFFYHLPTNYDSIIIDNPTLPPPPLPTTTTAPLATTSVVPLGKSSCLTSRFYLALRAFASKPLLLHTFRTIITQAVLELFKSPTWHFFQIFTWYQYFEFFRVLGRSLSLSRFIIHWNICSRIHSLRSARI